MKDFDKCRELSFAAFEAIRRGHMDVSERRNLCSRTRVNDFPPGGPGGAPPAGFSPKFVIVFKFDVFMYSFVGQR